MNGSKPETRTGSLQGNGGIMGFTEKDFVSPEKMFGADVRLEELPEGIRFFIKGQTLATGKKEIIVNLYELTRESDGLKFRRMHLERFINRIPEEEEIALKYGPNADGYLWIAKWKKDDTGEDTGVASDTIRISSKWQARHEAYTRMQATKAEAAAAPAASVSPVVSAAPSAWGPLEIMELINKGEDRAFRNMERMAAVLKGSQSDVPANVMEKAYESAGAIMQKAMESNLEMGRKVGKVIQREMDPPKEQDDDDDGGGEGMPGTGDPLAHLPAWLQPFIPKIETWLGTLLGGGPMGAAVKTLIISSEQWKEIFSDKDKFGQAVEAMRSHFGDEQTEKAMGILLNTRPAKPGKKKA